MTEKNFLLTGPPGCGKTTVILGLIQRLADFRLAGFYTQEIREGGQRVGFKAIGLSGYHPLLAHVRSESPYRIGRYGVEPRKLIRLIEAEFDRSPI